MYYLGCSKDMGEIEACHNALASEEWVVKVDEAVAICTNAKYPIVNAARARGCDATRCT
jgi:hypothetical protein